MTRSFLPCIIWLFLATTLFAQQFVGEPLRLAVFSEESPSPVLAAKDTKNCRRFLALDESRDQILYVDQFAPENNWIIPLKTKARDMMLVNDKAEIRTPSLTSNFNILVGVFKGGFREYDFHTQKQVREISDAQYKANSVAACRFDDGSTLLSCARNPNQGNLNEFYLLDAAGKEFSHFSYPDIQSVRCSRLTSGNTILFGANDNILFEGSLDGKIVRQTVIEGARYVYMAYEKENGNILLSTGFGCEIVELDKDWKVIRKWGGKPGPKGINYHFFASVQEMLNGHLFIAHWTGHGANDSEKGPQIIELDADGNIVWSWHDPKLAGTIHNAIVFEDQ